MNVKKIFVILYSALFITNTNLLMAACKNLKINNPKVEFVAFKTPSKVGVKGEFKDIQINFDKKAKISSHKELFEGRSFEISTQSLETNNEGRNQKILKHFFSQIDKISGKTVEFSESEIVIKLNLNNKNLIVPLKRVNEESQDKFLYKGIIDVFDFALHSRLSAINKACYDLHEGKTWNDVEIYLGYDLTCKD